MEHEKQTVSIEEFKKLQIRIGQIMSVEKVPDTDKLLKLVVDFGLEPSADGSSDAVQNMRQIVSGISTFFPDLNDLLGKKCAFAYNLEPRVIRGLESQGMILAVSGDTPDGSFFSLLETVPNVPAGSTVK